MKSTTRLRLQKVLINNVLQNYKHEKSIEKNPLELLLASNYDYFNKRIIIILLVLFSFGKANAQMDENLAIYPTIELNLGNYTGFDLNLNVVYEEKYSFKIGYTANRRTPISQPEDFSSGLLGLIPIAKGEVKPYDHFKNYQIGFGKIFILNERGTIRANISIGLGYTIIKEPEKWRKNFTVFAPTYNWSYKTINTLSLIINPKIEFPFTRFYGFSVSPMLQINKERTYFGIGIGQMIGLLRKKTNHIK